MNVFISDSRHPERLRGAPAYRAACMRRLSSFSHFCEPPSGHEPRALLPRARLVSSWRFTKYHQRNPKGKSSQLLRMHAARTRGAPREPSRKREARKHTHSGRDSAGRNLAVLLSSPRSTGSTCRMHETPFEFLSRSHASKGARAVRADAAHTDRAP